VASPSVTFTVIVATRYDTDSPIDETLLEDIIDNITNVAEQVSYGYTPAQAHDHDGVNSKLLGASIFGNLLAFLTCR